MLVQMLERVLAILSRISAHKRYSTSPTYTLLLVAAMYYEVTSVFFHGGEVDGLESEVALSGVHESVVETHVQPLLRAPQDGTQWTCGRDTTRILRLCIHS